MAQGGNLIQRIGRILKDWWMRGLDDYDTGRAIELRARRIFQAIMTEHCAECLAPVTVCRQDH